MTNTPSTRRREWLDLLVHELFQTEESAREHPQIEADRLGEVPPALVMREVSSHATRALMELPPLMRRHHLVVSRGGKAVGAALSRIRDSFADLLLSREKSYRATLLGMRHGVDLVEMISTLARVEGELELAAWCERWIAERRPLVEAAARELAWFAEHPERAIEAARPDHPLAIGLHALFGGFQRVIHRLRGAPEPAPL